MSAGDFEDLYVQNPDPWSYESSDYERHKYVATLAACGTGPHANALELGASIGVFSAMLSPRCTRLTTVDFAPTAVAAARRRLDGLAGVRVIHGRIPAAIPYEAYDLVVASEILYYLKPADLELTLAALRERLAPGGRLVAGGSLLRSQRWLTTLYREQNSDYLLDLLEFSPCA
jgi:protein-L-isoaspartate O-methyltransferase